jgi:hypothetical protein
MSLRGAKRRSNPDALSESLTPFQRPKPPRKPDANEAQGRRAWRWPGPFRGKLVFWFSSASANKACACFRSREYVNLRRTGDRTYDELTTALAP